MGLPEPQQYTHCLLALSLAKTCANVLLPAFAHCDELYELTEAATLQIDACMDSLPQRYLSRGAKRDLNDSFEVLARHIETDDIVGTQAKLFAWASNVWAAGTLVVDARNLCPLYTVSDCWRLLEESLLTLGERLSEVCKGCDEHGTEIYMEVA